MGRDPAEFEGVPLASVLAALRGQGVEVTELGDDQYLIARGEVERVFELQPVLYRRELYALARLFDVSKHILFRADITN